MTEDDDILNSVDKEGDHQSMANEDSSSTTTDPADDVASDPAVENGENVDEAVIDVLEGDAAAICRQEPILDEIDDSEPRKRRMMDDDDEDFFEDFIDDDKAYENVDEKQVWLDPYNADFNLKIFPDNLLLAEPLCEDGFAYMIAGVRASYGVNKGRVGFEIKALETLDISQVKPEEAHIPHELRVGWSTDTASLQLGESHYGYGYCSSTGKKVTEWRFSMYTEPFEVGDVIGCLVDFDKKIIEFTKNGQPLGVAFALGEEWDSVNVAGPPLFPHVATKNMRFEANFGQAETPWFGLPDGFTFINNVPLSDRIRGPLPPPSKSDCTVIMMVGLPGSGKTTWVDKFSQQHQEQRWNILSAPMVLDHMKVQGVSRKKLTQSRWDVMMGATVKCLNKMMTLACRKKKNYIIDQTNCYPQARRKKMTAFKDFRRKAVVIVPTAENHADRLHRQGMIEGKQMPPEAMLEMKACFTLPKEDDELFDEIEFIELDKDEAQRVVDHYNEEGKAFKPPEPKRRRGGDWIQQQENHNSMSSAKKDQSSTSTNAGGSHSYGQTSRLDGPQTSTVLQPVASNPSSSTSVTAASWSQTQAGQYREPSATTDPSPNYQHSYHHAYRYYHTVTPRSGWPSNWPQAQWHTPAAPTTASPSMISDSQSPAFPSPISIQNAHSSSQFAYPGPGSSGASTPLQPEEADFNMPAGTQ